MDEFEAKTELKNKRRSIRTLEDLTKFIEDVKDNYNTGYGTQPRAIAQATLATAWHLAGEMGITGFQAGFVMWDFIEDWLYSDNKCGMRIINYDEMLYPQYEYKFVNQNISKEVWENLQKEAKNRLESDFNNAHPYVIKHWQSIADGKVPFGCKISDEM